MREDLSLVLTSEVLITELVLVFMSRFCALFKEKETQVNMPVY